MAVYQIQHQTQYHFNQPVYLRPHLLKLRPRSNGWQQLLSYQCSVSPMPTGCSELVDLNGNTSQKLWFTQPTDVLSITVQARVELLMANPFNFLLEPWALVLPFDYPYSLVQQLSPYLRPYENRLDPVAVTLAQEIDHECGRNPLTFLQTLVQRLYQECSYTMREEGMPWEAGVTWRRKQGSCRDLTVLFMEVCRAMGLAARFVSGYEVGDEESSQWELHAWAEVYLPGAGWRGYDPTHGLAVGDRHIALAASPLPQYCAPVKGEVSPVKSQLETGLSVKSDLSTHLMIKERQFDGL